MTKRFSKLLILFAIGLFSGQHATSQVVHVYTGSIQTYIVPAGIFSLKVECSGAQGGDGLDPVTSPGGIGAYVSGDIVVNPGDQLNVIVGQRGGDAALSAHGGGGGGGSFVVLDNGNVPLMIASGGGAGSYQANAPGQVGQQTTAAGGGAYTAATAGQGGNSSNGGGGGYGAGGGGWFTSGTNNNWADGGMSAGGAGGVSTDPLINGGFGGGGGGFQGGGGGGGYTGGGGGSYTVGGGGGGSYLTGTNQSSGLATISGNGLVIITPICVALTVSPATSIDLCEGASIALSANSNSGGTISWDNGITNNIPFYPPAGTTVYTVTSSNPQDCPHSISVTEIPGPNVLANATATQVCKGSSITLTGSGADSYVWTNSVTDGIAFDPPVGNSMYHVTGTDIATGCQNLDSIDIFVSDPSTSFLVIDETAGNDGTIDLTLIDGVPPYTFDWDNDGVGDNDDPEDLTLIPGGTYSYIVIDAIGCIISGTVIVNTQLSINENNQKIELYPNPAIDVLNISTEGSFTYELINLSGKKIIIGQAVENTALNVDELVPGTYFIRIKTDNLDNVRKLIKQ